MSGEATAPLLSVRDLRTWFFTDQGVAKAVDGVSFEVREGETLGIVGESGCGKTVTSLSVLGLLPQPPARVMEGSSVRLGGEELIGCSEGRMRALRGNDVSMIFQEPMSSLNPVYYRGRPDLRGAALAPRDGPEGRPRRGRPLACRGRPSEPQRRLDEYPHQLSGGMRQRVMIAMALSCEPRLLIADEPTTALDVTIQAQILELLAHLREKHGMAVLLITHDLGVVAEVCDRVVVMYAGQVVETGTVHEIFAEPAHPYTRGLLASLPSVDQPGKRLDSIPGTVPNPIDWPHGCRFRARCSSASEACERPQELVGLGAKGARRAAGRAPRPSMSHRGDAVIDRTTAPLLSVSGLEKHFPLRKGMLGRAVEHVKAVDGVDFDIWRGETLGLVGESGCGKSTTGRALLRLLEPTAGEVHFDGMDVRALDRVGLRTFRRRAQFVFQDPFGSLNPRLSVGAMLEEVLEVHGLGGSNRRDRAVELLELVGLRSEHIDRYPHEFSGGQRQRLGVARALSVEPDFLVLDEPVSALDVSVQAQVVNLLEDLQAELGLTYLFIAHDLALVEHVSDRVAVMYLGRIVEIAEATDLYREPRHPYTRALLSAVPRPDPVGREDRERIVLEGDVPSAVDPPAGCPFNPRCPHPDKDDSCRKVRPLLEGTPGGHLAACHYQPSGVESGT